MKEQNNKDDTWIRGKNLNDELIEFIESHNYKVKKTDDGLVVDFDEKIILNSIITQKKSGDSYISRLDININFPSGKFIQESFGDFGIDKDTVRLQNLKNFIDSDFHVILSALNKKSDERVTIEKWAINKNIYEANIGNFIIKSSESFDIPENLFETISEIIKNKDLNDDYHAIRFFYANSSNESLAIELLIDNQLKIDSIEKIETLDWDRKESYYTIRNFIVLKKIHTND
jgi:hypothetical protein